MSRWLSPQERFDLYAEKSDGCWRWLGSLATDGYGRLRIPGGRQLAHRFSYEQYIGPIPDGLTIDHLCRNRACVNPDHLEAVSMRENLLRGEGPTAQHARQTHCKRGHPLTEDNIWLSRLPHRICRTCVLSIKREQYRTDETVRNHQREYKAMRRAAMRKPPQTHCKRGHPLSGDNLYRHPSGRRVCIACRTAYKQQWRANHR